MIVRYYIESVNIWWLGRLGGLKVCYGWKKGIFLGNSYLNGRREFGLRGVDNFGVDWWAMGICWGGVTGGRILFVCALP